LNKKPSPSPSEGRGYERINEDKDFYNKLLKKECVKRFPLYSFSFSFELVEKS